MNATAIKGLAVHGTAGRGSQQTVTDLILDLQERTVLALQVEDESGVYYAVRTDDVASVKDSVTVEAEAAPLPLDDQPQYAAKPTFDKIIHQSVISEDGRSMGTLADLDIDTSTWTVNAYAVATSITDAFEHGLRNIPAGSVRPGEKSMTVMGQPAER